MSARRASFGLFLVAALTIAACAGSDDSDGATDRATSSAEPTAAPETPPADSPLATDPPTETQTSATTARTQAPQTDGSASLPTTTLVPSAGADLPTARPSDTADTAPVTTVAGPLPTPEVSLIEVGAFDQPLDLTFRDLDSRLFAVQKNGQVIAFDDLSDEVVLDMADVDAVQVNSEGSEQGLLGLAFHPDTDFAYVNFTNGDGDTVVAEFTVDPDTATFDPSSYREVLSFEQPFSNHNGGDLAFGPDGLLYIATGDGGAGGDPDRNALDLSNRLGKLLRIDPIATDDGQPFGVPADNPFVDSPDADPTIWSYGLRNPWRFSFDSLTNDLWIGDVGQDAFEEIDLAPAVDGANAGRGLSFGWSAFEGNTPFNDDEPSEGHVPPVVAYPHENGACSVSAGVVARESSFADLNGWYVYGDFCSGQLWALDTTSVGIVDGAVVGEPVIVEIGNVPSLTAVRQGPDGDIYAISLTGPVLRLAPA